MSITPRFLRFRDAPAYLGMDKERFNLELPPKTDPVKQLICSHEYTL